MIMSHDTGQIIVMLMSWQVVNWDVMSITVSEAQMSSVDGLRTVMSSLRSADTSKMLSEMRKAFELWFKTTDRRIDALLLSAGVAGGSIKPGMYDEYAKASSTTSSV